MKLTERCRRVVIALMLAECGNFAITRVLGFGASYVGPAVSAGLGIWIAVHLYLACKAPYLLSAFMAGSVVLVDFALGVFMLMFTERSIAASDLGLALFGYSLASLVFAVAVIGLSMLCLSLMAPMTRLIGRLRR